MQSNEEIIVKVKNSIDPSPIVTSEVPLLNGITKGFFRVNESEISSKDRDKLKEIEEYLGDGSDMDKLSILKDIRYKLGTPRLGMSEIDHIHKYISIRNSIKQKETEMLAMEE